MVEACAHMGKRRGADRALVGKPEGKRPFGGRRHRWAEIRLMEDMDCIDLAEDRDSSRFL